MSTSRSRTPRRRRRSGPRSPPRERGKLIAECGRLLGDHVEELGRLVALETGKALRTESRVEASVVADIFTFFGGLGGELKGETLPFKPDMLGLTIREPIGVVGAIIPWNVPMMLMALKIAPALVAGNAVVVKSAEEAPLAVLRICADHQPDPAARRVQHPLGLRARTAADRWSRTRTSRK